MKKSKRPLAVVKLRSIRKIGDFLLFMRTLVLNIGNHALTFVTPVPALAGVTSDIDKLEDADTIAKTRVKGAAAARDLVYDTVYDEMTGLQLYVQVLADNAPDEATAISIIEASGFNLRNHGVHVKPPLSVKQQEDTDILILRAKAAGKRASYQWRQGSDGITWVDLPGTLQAKTTVTGVIAGEKLFFQERAILKNVITNWSTTVSIIVR
ncbi:MAG: hypothetical protein ABI855_00660 [Bacteroidota bacterium]